MSQTLRLLTYEFKRIQWILLTLFILTPLMQFWGITNWVNNRLDNISNIMILNNWSIAQYVDASGVIYFFDAVENAMFFIAPIMLSAAVLLLYAVFIWYREWLGRNMFIYRLLQLPKSRIHLLHAKVMVVFLSVLGLVGWQLILLPLEIRYFESLVEPVLRGTIPMDTGILRNNVLSVLIPQTFTQFIMYYGTGMMALLVLTAMILLERSFRLKGILAALVFGALSLGLYVLPDLVQYWTSGYFFAVEYVLMKIGFGLLTGALAFALSQHLLKHKVRV